MSCSSLTNIKLLEKWNVSNSSKFDSLFSCCSSLSDIKPLENRNVSSATNFKDIFSCCKSLSDKNNKKIGMFQNVQILVVCLNIVPHYQIFHH